MSNKKLTEEEFVEFTTGLFFNLQLANYDAGLTIAENIINSLSNENIDKEEPL